MFQSPFGQQFGGFGQQFAPPRPATGMFGAPLQGMAPPAQPGQGGDHHSKLHQMLPYLAMGLLPMLMGGIGGGSLGQIAQFASPLAFGLHKAKVF